MNQRAETGPGKRPERGKATGAAGETEDGETAARAAGDPETEAELAKARLQGHRQDLPN